MPLMPSDPAILSAKISKGVQGRGAPERRAITHLYSLDRFYCLWSLLLGDALTKVVVLAARVVLCLWP